MSLPRAPLFPLPDTILFPGQILPLHVFEHRYRQMTLDLLDGKGELIIGTVLGDDQLQLEHTAPVQPVAGLGRLERYEKLPDGRYLIILLGIGRVNVYPVESPHPFPLAEYQPINAADSIEEDLETKIRRLIDAKQEFNSLPEQTDPAQLVDILIMTAEISVEEKYHFFSLGDLHERAAQIVEAYGE